MHALASTYLPKLLPLTPQAIYLVGGSVRDLLIGKQDIKDIDLLMSSGSENTARAFADIINGSFFFLDEERRITRVTKRDDSGLIQFDFTNFEGQDLHADLRRRDFTINAMALDLRVFLRQQSLDGLIDLFRGKDDVENKIVRMTRAEVLNDDPLRLLRAVRFAATLGFTIEASTAEHIQRRARSIALPSPERVRDELFMILDERNAERHLLLMNSLGLLAPIIPELESLRGFAPGRYHVHDVLTHSIKTAGNVDTVLDGLPAATLHSSTVIAHLAELLEHQVTRKAALRFACLIHDNAKPETFTNSDGHVRFHGHDNQGADKAVAICRRLRLSNNTEKAITKVIRQHMRLFNLSTPGGPSRNALYRYCRDLGDAIPESLILAQADARATSEIMPKDTFMDTTKTMAIVLDFYYTKYLKAEEKPLVSGQDLIRLGLTPGPRFHEILDEVKEKQAEGVLRSRQVALEYLEKFKKL